MGSVGSWPTPGATNKSRGLPPCQRGGEQRDLSNVARYPTMAPVADHQLNHHNLLRHRIDYEGTEPFQVIRSARSGLSLQGIGSRTLMAGLPRL
jgi:hypothetical protein